jgi:hypothetical protein
MYSVLEKFKDNKLLLNHIFRILKTSFNLLRKIKGSDSLTITLVSSAKRIGVGVRACVRVCVCVRVRLCARVCRVQKDSVQRIFIKKCFLFAVGSVCRIKRITTGSRNTLKDVRKSQMMPDQAALFRLRQKQLFRG